MTFTLSYDGAAATIDATLIHRWERGDVKAEEWIGDGGAVTTFHAAAASLFQERADADQVAYLRTATNVPLLLISYSPNRWWDVTGKPVKVVRKREEAQAA